MAAHDATLTEALGILRGPAANIAHNVLHDGVVFWIGSGVSRERFPLLRSLLQLLLTELHRVQDPGNPDCVYRSVSRQIVAMTTFRTDTEIDVTQSPVNWPPAKLTSLLEQLENQYADVLGIPFQGGGGNSLAWDFLKLQHKYGDTTVLPDAEHRLLALLAAEGAVSEIITTNWDPLIEHAHMELGCAPTVEVVACTQELNRPGTGTLIFKIHGCAKRMLHDSGRYRPHMVATRNDINRWTGVEFFQPFREQVRAMLRTRPAIFVGLSGQDFNLQEQCIVSAVGGVDYAFDPPRIAFTVSAIGAPQRAILHGVYGEKYAANDAVVNNKAMLPLYGKPLLGGLFLLLLADKLECVLKTCGDQFPFDGLRTLTSNGIKNLESLLTVRFDAILAPDDRWRTFAAELPGFVARMLTLFREQRVPIAAASYQPIHLNHSGLMATDPILASANLHWLLLAGVLFEEGQRLGKWNIELALLPTGEDGQFRAKVGAPDEVAVFFLNRDTAQQKLEDNGVLRPGFGRRVLMVYPSGPKPARPRRSPARVLPGTSSSRIVSEIWLQEMAEQVNTTDELLDMVRSDLIAAAPI